VTTGVLAIFANEAMKAKTSLLWSCLIMLSDLNSSKEILNISLNQLKEGISVNDTRIADSFISLHPLGLLNPATAHVAEAYDGFRIAVCRPQGSSRLDDHGALIHLDIQAQLYSGHVKLITSLVCL
jgi:hypothetical protein